MRIPVSTYRLQVRESFDLSAVAAVTAYLHDLGADWVYLSPLLEAEPHSDHGYDVIDHARIDPARGGKDGLEEAVAAAREAGLGILIDIVPNHMGVATPVLNAWWWDLLTHGQASRYAEAFDVDWDAAAGKIRIPVLGDGDALGEVAVDGDELVYYDNRFPLAPGTADDGADARAVHGRQHYELINWRRADDDLNYRRFFAVNSLAGIRVEVPHVFDESHAEIGRWFAGEPEDRLADGLRVDHPDGLRDPRGYLQRLSALTDGGYVLVEKILEPGEKLPADWAVSGTTGYETLAEIDRVFVDPAGQGCLDSLDTRLRGPGEPASWPDLIHQTKRGIADGILHSEVLRIVRELASAAETPARDPQLADAVSELLACFPVYRSYLPEGTEYLDAAVTAATGRRPDLAATIGRAAAVLADRAHPAALRFQQTSGMVMAKGVEDTAFYRYTRLTSLNEVGADPSIFSLDVDDFHRRQQRRLQQWPHTMTTLSTHDTKRGEDVRARISVLAELPELWTQALDQLRQWALVGDGPLENLLWQAILGSWPASRQRLHAYAEKAAREAGNSTGWTSVNEPFEARMHALVDAAFDDERVESVLARLYREVRGPGFSNGLSAKLVQLTGPGVPDVYQGSELWELSLVDPDNRRPVDFAVRRRLLAEITAGSRPPVDESGAAKLLVTWRALTLRRDRPELFAGYQPITGGGTAAEHVLAFDRGGAVTVATRLPVGLARAGGWRDTSITVARGRYVDALTDRPVTGGTVRVQDLLSWYPVALLIRDEDDA